MAKTRTLAYLPLESTRCARMLGALLCDARVRGCIGIYVYEAVIKAGPSAVTRDMPAFACDVSILDLERPDLPLWSDQRTFIAKRVPDALERMVQSAFNHFLHKRTRQAA